MKIAIWNQEGDDWENRTKSDILFPTLQQNKAVCQGRSWTQYEDFLMMFLPQTFMIKHKRNFIAGERRYNLTEHYNLQERKLIKIL